MNTPEKNADLKPEVLLALGKELGFAMGEARGAASGLLDKVKVWRDQYDGELPTKKMKWQSNVNVPETKATIRAATVQIADAAFMVDPIFEIESQDPQYDEQAQDVGNFCEFWHERSRLRTKGTMAINDALITGQSWLKASPKSTGLDSTGNGGFGGPTNVLDLDTELECDYVITEDMCLMPFTAESFNQAFGALGRKWMRWSEIEKLSESEGFFKTSVESVKLRWQDDNSPSQTQVNQGIDEAVVQTINQARFECWEGIYRWVKPDDKEEKDWFIVAYYKEDSGGDAIVLKCTEYEPVFGKQWFFVPIICDPRPKSLWGGSICEDIRGLQGWINATFNQCTDAVTISILPPIAIPPGSEAYRRNSKWQPMEKWPLSNPAEAQIMSAPASMMAGVSAAMAQTQFVERVKERVTGTSEVAQGTTTTGQRTKFEISAVIESASQIYKHQVAMIQFGMDETQGLEAYATLTLNLLQRFMPRQMLTYRAARGKDKWAEFDPAALDGKYRFIPRGSTSVSNVEVRFKRAMATREAIVASPFAQISTMDSSETVFDKVKRWYKAESEYIQAMGNKRPELWIGEEPTTPEEAMAIAYKISPAEVAAILAREQGGGMPGTPSVAGGMVPPGGPTGGPGGNGGGNPGSPEVGGSGIPGPGGNAGMEAPQGNSF